MLDKLIVAMMVGAFYGLINMLVQKKKNKDIEDAPAAPEPPKSDEPVQRADPNVWTCRHCGTQNPLGTIKCSNCHKS